MRLMRGQEGRWKVVKVSQDKVIAKSQVTGEVGSNLSAPLNW